MKRLKCEFIYEEEAVDLPTDPAGFLAFWQETLSVIPKDAVEPYIDFDAGYEHGCLKVEITVKYHRLETDEEMYNRGLEVARKAKELENKEKALLQRLKDKYE